MTDPAVIDDRLAIEIGMLYLDSGQKYKNEIKEGIQRLMAAAKEEERKGKESFPRLLSSPKTDRECVFLELETIRIQHERAAQDVEKKQNDMEVAKNLESQLKKKVDDTLASFKRRYGELWKNEHENIETLRISFSSILTSLVRRWCRHFRWDVISPVF